MLTVTKELMLPATVTESWPRPRWDDGDLWCRSADPALQVDVFRDRVPLTHLPTRWK